MKTKSGDRFQLDESDSTLPAIIKCRKCARTINHCRAVAEKKIMRRAKFADDTYWGRPVPNFGKPPAKLLIVGLAPGAHGANRTGRMFTGDDSGLWLYRALHKAGFAETSNCTEVGDNRLIECSITAVTHCAPPGNKPLPDEIRSCEPFLIETFRITNPQVVIALGAIAWDASLRAIERVYEVSMGRGFDRPKFEHGKMVPVNHKTDHSETTVHLLASYHVSRQNTNTGRLTELMLDQVFAQARRLTRISKY